MTEHDDPMRDIDDVHLQWLMEHLLKMRGPAVVDPDLPSDPDAEEFPAGVRDWANEQMVRIRDEQQRRKREQRDIDQAFDDQIGGVQHRETWFDGSEEPDV